MSEWVGGHGGNGGNSCPLPHGHTRLEFPPGLASTLSRSGEEGVVQENR